MTDKEVEFLLSEGRKVLDALWSSADRLANHASLLITVGVSILTGALIVVSTSSTAISHWFFFGAAVVVIVALVVAASAYYIRWFWYPPKSFELTTDNRWTALLNVADAYVHDVDFLETRTTLVNISLILFAGSVTLLLIGTATHFA